MLGTGVDIVYPQRNAALAAEIAARGLLVSEFPLGTAPSAHNFPRRNRLISGLARGCLVVEAALASGSLITARSAAEQGREVFAVPGSIHSPLVQGLPRADQVGRQAGRIGGGRAQRAGRLSSERLRLDARSRLAACPSAAEGGLLAHMGHDPVDVDSLCSRAGMSAEQVSSELLRLELDGPRRRACPAGCTSGWRRKDAGKPNPQRRVIRREAHMYDILVYLFENCQQAELAYDSDRVAKKLSAAGFEDSDISEALHWLAGVLQRAAGRA